MNTAHRTHGFRESVIRGMTRLAREHRSINLAQGFPNFPAPQMLKDAAARAVLYAVYRYRTNFRAGSSVTPNVTVDHGQQWKLPNAGVRSVLPLSTSAAPWSSIGRPAPHCRSASS